MTPENHGDEPGPGGDGGASPSYSGLSRISRALRKQEWSVVSLELVIVVAGVFLGIEASNWNAERSLRAQEASYLLQVRSEILQNTESIEYQIRFVEQGVNGGRRALDYLEGGSACASDCERLLVDFFHSSQVWGTGYRQATYDELIRQGLPTDEGVRRALESFYLFLDGWAAVNATPPPYRERMRGYIAPGAFEVLWQGCYRIVGGQREVLSHDCAPHLDSVGVRSTLQALQGDPELAHDLRYWIGQNISALNFYPDMLAEADSAVRTIDAVLGTEP